MSAYLTPRSTKPPAIPESVPDPAATMSVVPPPSTPGVDDVPAPTPAVAKNRKSELAPASKRRGYFGFSQPSSPAVGPVPDPIPKQPKPEESQSEKAAGEAVKLEASTDDAVPESKLAPKKRGYFGRSQPASPALLPVPEPQSGPPAADPTTETTSKDATKDQPAPPPKSELKPAPQGYGFFFRRSQPSTPANEVPPEPQAERSAAQLESEPQAEPSAANDTTEATEDQPTPQPKSELKPAAEVPPEPQSETSAAQPEAEAVVEPEPVPAPADEAMSVQPPPGGGDYRMVSRSPVANIDEKEADGAGKIVPAPFKTTCACAGSSADCTCPPETCACTDCGKVQQPPAKWSDYIFRRPKDPVPYNAAKLESLQATSVIHSVPGHKTNTAEPTLEPYSQFKSDLFPRRFGIYNLVTRKGHQTIRLGCSAMEIFYCVTYHTGIMRPRVIIHRGATKHTPQLACATSSMRTLRHQKRKIMVTLDIFSKFAVSRPRGRKVTARHGAYPLMISYFKSLSGTDLVFLRGSFQFEYPTTGTLELFLWKKGGDSDAVKSLGEEQTGHELILAKTGECIAVFALTSERLDQGVFAFVSQNPLGERLELMAVITLLAIFRDHGFFAEGFEYSYASGGAKVM